MGVPQANILVVDDEKNIRMLLSDCLEMAGYKVDIAIDGEHALEKAKASGYDLVLLDMKLPGIDGLEVLRQIKMRDSNQTVIMITAHGTVATAVEAMKLGAVDYLQKPFTPEEIRAIVRKVLDRRQIKDDVVPESFDVCLERAKLRITEQRFPEATPLLKKAISLNPNSPEAYNLLGAIYELTGALDQAQKMYRAALAVDPSYRPAESNLHRTTQLNYAYDRKVDMGERDPGTGDNPEEGEA